MPSINIVSDYISKIRSELFRAIALEAMFEVVKAGPVVAHARGLDVGTGFDLMRDAIHRDLISTILKLMDADPNSISFLGLRNKMRAYWNDARGVPAGFDEFCTAVEGYRTHRGLWGLRDRVIAHNDRRAPQDAAHYGEESAYLVNLCELFRQAEALLGRFNTDIEAYRMASIVSSRQFWAKFCGVDL
jgi:hypothetical protein